MSGARKMSANKFQTDGPATEKATRSNTLVPVRREVEQLSEAAVAY